MEIFQIVAVVLIAALLAVTLRSQRPEMALVLSLATGALVLFMLLPTLSQMVQQTKSIASEVSGMGTIAAAVLKMIGVAYISEYGASLCRDAEENALAFKIETGGRLLILAMATPFVLSILHSAVSLLSGGG
ncbi:MAG: SpoIIIAC/SpoIIIAD family protein [Christensenellales bacterium]|jgi:stage III sporulation protein AD